MSDDQKSFNDAMNEWRAQQSLFVRLFHRYFHLPSGHGMGSKIQGVIWRLLLPVALGWFVFCILVSAHIRSEEFQAAFASKLGSFLRAEDGTMEIKNLKWGGRLMKMKSIEATGGSGSFFDRLVARNVSMQKEHSFWWPFAVSGDSPWSFGHIKASQIEIELKSGYESGSGADESARENGTWNAPDGGLKRAGYGVDPDLSKASFDRITSTSATLTWGYSATTGGEIVDTALDASRDEAGAWHLEMTGGTLSQSWVEEVEIELLKVLIKGDQILFEEARLNIGGQPVEMEGSVALGKLPLLDIVLHFDEVNPKQLISQNYVNTFGGRLTGDLKIGGSINSKDGVTTAAEFSISDGSSVRTPMAFKDFGAGFEQPGLHPFYVKEGSIKLTTARGVLSIDDITLKSAGASMITGSFEIDEGSFYGEVNLGLNANEVSKYPQLADKYFGPAEDGLRWHRNMELRGELAELTKPLSEQLAAEIFKTGREK